MSKVYSCAEVAAHNKENDLWIVKDGKVYDITKYVDEHPGGVDTLAEVAGKDATYNYNSVGHSEDAQAILEKFLIGKLDPADSQQLPSAAISSKTSYTSLAVIAVLLSICFYFILA